MDVMEGETPGPTDWDTLLPVLRRQGEYGRKHMGEAYKTLLGPL